MQFDAKGRKLLTLDGRGRLAVLEDGALPLDVEETVARR